MLIFNYDKNTKEYTGYREALKDPLESKKAKRDIFLIPAHSTTLEVPSLGKNEIALFNGKTWEVKKDFRGQVFYNKLTREKVTISVLGDIPSNLVKVLPFDLEVEKNKILEEIKINHEESLRVTYTFKNNVKYCVNDLNPLLAEVKEKENNFASILTRDSSNNIVDLTFEEAKYICEHLARYKQVLYVQKWTLQDKVSKVLDRQSLENSIPSLEITLTQEQADNLSKMSKVEINNYLKDIQAELI